MKTYEYKYGALSAVVWVNDTPRRVEFVKGSGGYGYYHTSDTLEQKAIESRRDYKNCFSVSEESVEEVDDPKKRKVKE